MVKVQVIVTVPPYADYLLEVANHPLVCGFRLNTVMPLKEKKKYALERLMEFQKDLWVDLKGRQLRIVGAAIPPFTEVLLSHEIEVPVPVNMYLSDGRESAKVLGVSGKRLILDGGVRRLIGPGESVNIPHKDLIIKGTLTDNDMEFLRAMKVLGLRNVMLSFAESNSDIHEVTRILPDAIVVQKIESQKGIEYVHNGASKFGRLMAARGDLYIEVGRPHMILQVLQEIIHADKNAIAGSRLFESLVYHPVPSSADLSDVAYLILLGYRTFLFGDVLCQQRDTLIEALNLLQSVVKELS